MTISCPRCLRSLSTADPNGPPVFCMYCGQKLGSTSPSVPSPTTVPPIAPGERTASFVPFGPDPDADPEPIVEEVGGYRLVRLIGAGGMGTVYEAEVPGGGNRVAVKLLSPRLAASPSSVERFKQEGRLASQLTHPRCVFVLGADTDAGRPYIVMELMPGRTLKDLVDQKGPLPPHEAIAYILDVIDGLAEAHRLGVLHRDVKPSNCFLTDDGRVKVGDFGLSKSLAGSNDRHHLTQTGAFLGTVLFASPEQIRGEPLDYASDVYSVCATLYFLLAGEAPYHHESVTAALAKAISEPPPPICPKRPDVDRALERIVMRGLERDRDRRWQTLDELRDALLDLLPERQTPARPRMLVGAYLLDRIALGVLTGPVELLRQVLTGTQHILVDPFELRWLAVAIMLAYFTLFEGLLGATPGKWLLGLRVSRVGRTGPPGVLPAFVRALVFTLVIICTAVLPGLLVEWLGPVGGILGVVVFVLGATALLLQLRKTTFGYRGVHDFASGCHVTQRPLPARKLRLTSRHPNRLDAVLPVDPATPLPETVGGYAVRGRVWADDTLEQVWVAEDRALGRRVLLWLQPANSTPTLPPAGGEVARPTRLRRLGQGRLGWAGHEFDWRAFAAPVGAPLADTVHPDRPLPWADARHLLEQLVDEFQTAEADGSTPGRLGLDQVWVEPTGRVQVLDVPMSPPGHGQDGLPSKQAGGTPALQLLRQVASLTLEGRSRTEAYPELRWGRAAPGVRAPVPPHATPVLTKLFAPDGYRSLADLHRDLRDTHAHAPEVTPSIRAAQIGIQATLLSPGLFLLFFVVAIVAVVLAWTSEVRAGHADAALRMVRDPQRRAELAREAGLEAALNDPQTAVRLEAFRDRRRAEAADRRSHLLSPQRFILDQFPDPGSASPASDRSLREMILRVGGEGVTPAEGSAVSMAEAAPIWVVLGAVLLVWVMFATVFRGGVSLALAGIALVRADGRKATRRQCALRSLAVWVPVLALLAGSVWVQVRHPDWRYVALSLWLLALALLPVYVVVALRNPARPPQDRVAGTYLVPA